MVRSLIYSNIHVYRLVMNALYRGAYTERFRRLTGHLDPGTGSVCEPCFGDTWIAEWCAERDILWVGVDVNPGFCARARSLGHDVLEGDLLEVDPPAADTYVMAGSLYHFHRTLPAVFDTVFARTRRFLISEPILNVSSWPGLVGWLARRSAHAGAGDARFRYSAESLVAAVRAEAARKNLTIRVLAEDRDMILDIVSEGAPDVERGAEY